MILALFYWFC